MGCCVFCGTGVDWGSACNECVREYERRQNAGLCVFCGRASRVEFDWCGSCGAGERPVPYVGYPPEGA